MNNTPDLAEALHSVFKEIDLNDHQAEVIAAMVEAVITTTDEENYSSSSQSNADPLKTGIDPRLSLRDILDRLYDLPIPDQRPAVTGAITAIATMAPWLLDEFFSRWQAHPISADTSDALQESRYFMQYDDRGERARPSK